MKKKLQARLKAIHDRCNAIVSDADKDNEGLMTEEQQTEFDNLMAEAENINAQIGRLDKLEQQNQQLNAGDRQTTANNPRIVVVGDRAEMDIMAGFSTMGEFGQVVMNACKPHGTVDDRLKVLGAPTNFHQESGSDGYQVPAAFREQIWELVFDDVDLVSMVDSEPTGSNSVQFLADETTPWGSTGVLAKWAAEGSQFNATKLETKGETMKLHKLFAFVLATDELLEDSPRLGDRLTRRAAQAIRWKSSDAIVYGTGAGQPLGYFNSNALVSVAKETSQSADTIQAANIAKMFSRNLNPGRSVWMANSDTLPQLMTMTIGNQPIWTPPNAGYAQAPGGFLLGRPIMFSEHAKTLGDKGDIQFIDPMGYYAAVKNGGIKFNMSIHLYFDYDINAFRWTFRIGGQPFLSTPVTPANGSNTKSHFVVLDERA